METLIIALLSFLLIAVTLATLYNTYRLWYMPFIPHTVQSDEGKVLVAEVLGGRTVYVKKTLEDIVGVTLSDSGKVVGIETVGGLPKFKAV